VTPAAELRVAHTADLDAATRQAARALLDESQSMRPFKVVVDVAPPPAARQWPHQDGRAHPQSTTPPSS